MTVDCVNNNLNNEKKDGRRIFAIGMNPETRSKFFRELKKRKLTIETINLGSSWYLGYRNYPVLRLFDLEVGEIRFLNVGEFAIDLPQETS